VEDEAGAGWAGGEWAAAPIDPTFSAYMVLDPYGEGRLTKAKPVTFYSIVWALIGCCLRQWWMLPRDGKENRD
jgi:hypothetical protein